MADTFTVGADTATFVAYDQGYRGEATGALKEWTLPILVGDATAWGLLNTLRTPKELVTVRTIAGQVGTTPQVVIDIGGGAGQGQLVVENLDPHNAILLGLQESFIDQAGARLATAMFLITDA